MIKMDPGIDRSRIGQDNSAGQVVKFVSYPQVLELELEKTGQRKNQLMKPFHCLIRSKYLKTDSALIFANLDSLFNFSQRSGGFLAVQEKKQRTYFSSGKHAFGLRDYMNFRFLGAEGIVQGYRNQVHLDWIELGDLSTWPLDQELENLIPLGAEVMTLEFTFDNIFLSARHLKQNGRVLFWSEDLSVIGTKMFSLALKIFDKISVIKPLVLIGTQEYYLVAETLREGFRNWSHEILSNETAPETDPNQKEFQRILRNAFDIQNRIDIQNRSQFNLSKLATWWNLH